MRSERTRRIRRRVIAGSVALFVAVWLLITITLASGHDPALASTATKRVASVSDARSTTSTRSSQRGHTSRSSGASSESSPAGTAVQSGPSPVTTSQS